MPENFLTAPLSLIKQVGEQTNQTVQSIGNSMASTASKGIDSIIQNAPALPGLPGGEAKSMLPTSLQSVLTKVEEILPMPKTKTTAPSAPAAPAPAADTAPKVATRKVSNGGILEMRGM